MYNVPKGTFGETPNLTGRRNSSEIMFAVSSPLPQCNFSFENYDY